LLPRSKVLKTEVNRPQEIPGRSLSWMLEEKVSSKREKSSRVAALEEYEAATRDFLSLKQRAKDSGRYLGGVSGGFRRKQCPLKEKYYLR